MSHALATFGPCRRDRSNRGRSSSPVVPFLFSDMRDGEEIQNWGTYLTLKRPSVIHCTWFTRELSEREGSSDVRIEIASRAGGCSARLTHRMPATYAKYTERAERGWKTILASIEASLSVR